MQKPPDAAYPSKLITLGDHLRKARLDLGLSQSEMGKMLNLTKDAVYKWEANVCEPLPKYAKSIIAYLGYCPSWGNSPGMQFKRARMKAGLTIRGAAKLIGCSELTLTLYEKDQRIPFPRTHKKILAFIESIFATSTLLLKEKTDERHSI